MFVDGFGLLNKRKFSYDGLCKVFVFLVMLLNGYGGGIVRFDFYVDLGRIVLSYDNFNKVLILFVENLFG